MTDEAKLSGFNLFSDEIKQKFTTQKVVITKKDIQAAWLTDPGLHKVYPYCLDDEYHVVSPELSGEIIRASKTDRFFYEKYFDCDKFALMLKAECSTLEWNAVGWVIDWSGAHSYNVVAVHDPESEFKCGFVFFEPQSDNKLQIGDLHHGIYKLETAHLYF